MHIKKSAQRAQFTVPVKVKFSFLLSSSNENDSFAFSFNYILANRTFFQTLMNIWRCDGFSLIFNLDENENGVGEFSFRHLSKKLFA